MAGNHEAISAAEEIGAAAEAEARGEAEVVGGRREGNGRHALGFTVEIYPWVCTMYGAQCSILNPSGDGRTRRTLCVGAGGYTYRTARRRGECLLPGTLWL